ncbi:site-2 protease family protein [Candidatus Micrarchaeota archaeon]|nr:site-2 protease family protein [Candidatus Micrarchaeota archaeon]
MRNLPAGMRAFLLTLLVLASFALIYAILQTDFSAPLKFAASVALLIFSARGVTAITGIPSEWGIIMLRTKKGIEIVKSLARNEEFWKLFADTGVFLAFGLMGYFVVKRPAVERIKLLGVSMVLLSFLILFVSPMVLPFLSISLGLNIGTDSGGVTKSTDLVAPTLLASAIFLGGLSTMVSLSIISYGITVIGAIASTLLMGADAISETSPGVTLLLPGVNLPLIEGILALIIILIVHEGAHAILSVIGKVPLLSSGLALFGVIPMGAFVEPDEKRLLAKSPEIQTRVIVAGSAANLMTSIIFFVLLFGFLFVTDPLKEKGWLVLEGMENETIIHSINGIAVEDIGSEGLNLKPNSEVVLETSLGTVTRETNHDGKIGIIYSSLSYAPLARYNFFPLDFTFRLLALTFCLNFIIGVVNLLPLPFFDGYRLLELNIPQKWIPKAIMYVCIIAFLMNFLPWFF